MRGMTRSLMMMVGRKTVMRWSASSPSPAESVMKPHVRTNSVQAEPRAGLVLDDEDSFS